MHVLSQVDVLVVLEVYAAGEAHIAGADSRALCRSVRNLGKIDPVYVSDNEKLSEVMEHLLQDGDLILAQGAGNVSKLSRQLVERWNENRIS